MGVFDTAMNKAVFLDRDGVVNRAVIREGKPYPPKDLSELVVPPECSGLLESLKRAGYVILVVSNQPDVARGTQSRDTVELINATLQASLPIDDFFMCYHDDQAHCLCRKPKPGLILQAAEQHHVDVSKSFMIGDRWRDIEAGISAGCRTVFIDYGYAEMRPVYVDYCVGGLRDAVAMVMAND